MVRAGGNGNRSDDEVDSRCVAGHKYRLRDTPGQGHLWVASCQVCGQEIGGTFYPGDQLDFMERKRVQLVLRLGSVPRNASLLLKLRELFEQYQTMPLSELKQLVATRDVLCLSGDYAEPEATRMANEAAQRGINVEIVPD